MPQFGLLFILVVLPMIICLAEYAPGVDARGLQRFMEGISLDALRRFRASDLLPRCRFNVVWPDFAAVAASGPCFSP